MVALAWTTACASAPPPAPTPTRTERVEPIPRRDRPLLINPVEGFDLGLDDRRRAEISNAFADLMAGGTPAEALLAARRLLEVDPTLAPAVVLAAQAELLEEDADSAARRLRPVVESLPTYSAALLAHGLAEEKLGRVVEAYASYRASLTISQLASERAERLQPRAVEIVNNRLEDALEQGRLNRAERELERLEMWAPDDERSMQGRLDFAVAAGDPVAELSALRALAESHTDDLEWTTRRGTLEMEVGDATAGLQIFQRLATEHPDRPEIAEGLAMARFRWRLQLLPEEVRALANVRPELNRAQLAALLYWLVPDVRYGRPQRARIANDILDHEQRDEIARVINLGLMGVDATRHHFSPDLAASRADALRALLIVLSEGEKKPACLGGRGFDQRSSVESLCGGAVRCLVLRDASECLLRSALTGPEAVEMIRRALDQQ